MAQTNVQAFSGDVEISSNLAVDTNTLFVDSVGNNVGIGTTNPGTPLHILSTNEITTSPAGSGVSQLRYGTANSTMLFGVSSTAGHISAYDTSNFSTNRKLCLNADGGNVGIGTTDPGTALDVVGTVTATSYEGSGANLTGISDVNDIKIGNGAGTTNQGDYAVAVGSSAGQTSQGTNATAVGREAGQTSQGVSAVAVGYLAGATGQGARAVAVGRDAGKTGQGSAATAVGYLAGETSQGANAVAVGYLAGQTSQGTNAVAVGIYAGSTGQGAGTVAVGNQAGQTSQGSQATAVGVLAGETSQGDYAVAVGSSAGQTGQGSYSVAVGQGAGNTSQGDYAVAVGIDAGSTGQGNHGVAVGRLACSENNNNYAIGIGDGAGCDTNESGGDLSISIGHRAGQADPAVESIAIGYLAGYRALGSRTIAIGKNALFGTVAHSDTIALGSIGNTGGSGRFYTGVMRDANGNEYVHYLGSELVRGNNYSDDRLKFNEKYITSAIKSLFKIRPQTYDMKPKINPDHDDIWKFEAGVIAQDIYYQAPELRHIVNIPLEAGDIDSINPVLDEDPTVDPDYSVWGPKPASVKYQQFIPYLIKAVQEIVTELPRSKTTASNTWGQNLTGLIVSANTNKHKTNTIPMVNVSNVSMDKSWYGVVSDKTTDTNDYDILVDTNGPTRIWVSDVGGQLESGDLISTSNIIPGYGQKQVDDIIRNYTVAKVTQDCDFTEPTQKSIMVPTQELSNVAMYQQTVYRDISLSEWEKLNDLHKRIRGEDSWIAEGTCIAEECDATCEEHYDENGTHITDKKYKKMTHEEQCCCTHVTKQIKEELNCTCEYFDGDTHMSVQKYESLTEEEQQTITMKWISYLPLKMYKNLTEQMKTRYTMGTRPFYEQVERSISRTQLPAHDEVVEIQEMIDILDENGQIVWKETEQTESIYTLVDHGTHKAALLTCKFV